MYSWFDSNDKFELENYAFFKYTLIFINGFYTLNCGFTLLYIKSGSVYVNLRQSSAAEGWHVQKDNNPLLYSLV